METKNIILKLRTERGMSQDELADKIMVTRQAVSRWENGDTVPNTDTLKFLSKEFDVSINTLLGEPRKLICQCCGMPIDDDSILGRDKDGTLNEEYCKWCYADGTYTYNDMDELIDVCVKNMVNENFTEEQARSYLKEMLPKLDYWKRYDELSDNGQFEEFKKKLINEINDLHIDGLPRVDKLNALVGKYVNLEYTLPDISQSVIITRMEGRTPVPSKESIQSFAAHQATMVVFLSTGMLEELSRRLIEGGYTADTPAAIVYKATWPDEKKFVCTVGTLAQTAAENNITKTALMIIGDSVKAAHYDRSKLYDPGFTTEFREATE